jgi:hypothetical protein
MVLDLRINDSKRLERLKRSLNASERDVISKALEVLERREVLRAEVLKPMNELALREVRVVRQRH